MRFVLQMHVAPTRAGMLWSGPVQKKLDSVLEGTHPTDLYFVLFTALSTRRSPKQTWGIAVCTSVFIVKTLPLPQIHWLPTGWEGSCTLTFYAYSQLHFERSFCRCLLPCIAHQVFWEAHPRVMVCAHTHFPFLLLRTVIRSHTDSRPTRRTPSAWNRLARVLLNCRQNAERLLAQRVDLHSNIERRPAQSVCAGETTNTLYDHGGGSYIEIHGDSHQANLLQFESHWTSAFVVTHLAGLLNIA